MWRSYNCLKIIHWISKSSQKWKNMKFDPLLLTLIIYGRHGILDLLDEIKQQVKNALCLFLLAFLNEATRKCKIICGLQCCSLGLSCQRTKTIIYLPCPLNIDTFIIEHLLYEHQRQVSDWKSHGLVGLSAYLVFTWMFHAFRKTGVPVQRNEALEVSLELLWSAALDKFLTFLSSLSWL